MLTNLFFAEVPGVRVEQMWREGATLHLALRATRCWARCPLCQRGSHRQQSTYQRTLADLPCAGERVIVHLRVRCFVCRVRWCRRTGGQRRHAGHCRVGGARADDALRRGGGPTGLAPGPLRGGPDLAGAGSAGHGAGRERRRRPWTRRRVTSAGVP